MHPFANSHLKINHIQVILLTHHIQLEPLQYYNFVKLQGGMAYSGLWLFAGCLQTL